jgi:hypothetical protein
VFNTITAKVVFPTARDKRQTALDTEGRVYRVDFFAAGRAKIGSSELLDSTESLILIKRIKPVTCAAKKTGRRKNRIQKDTTEPL